MYNSCGTGCRRVPYLHSRALRDVSVVEEAPWGRLRPPELPTIRAAGTATPGGSLSLAYALGGVVVALRGALRLSLPLRSLAIDLLNRGGEGASSRAAVRPPRSGAEHSSAPLTASRAAVASCGEGGRDSDRQTSAELKFRRASRAAALPSAAGPGYCRWCRGEGGGQRQRAPGPSHASDGARASRGRNREHDASPRAVPHEKTSRPPDRYELGPARAPDGRRTQSSGAAPGSRVEGRAEGEDQDEGDGCCRLCVLFGGGTGSQRARGRSRGCGRHAGAADWPLLRCSPPVLDNSRDLIDPGLGQWIDRMED